MISQPPTHTHPHTHTHTHTPTTISVTNIITTNTPLSPPTGFHAVSVSTYMYKDLKTRRDFSHEISDLDYTHYLFGD